MIQDPDLPDDVIDRICEPLTQNAAKARYLRSLGLKVDRKPNGRPLVNRAHYDAVRGGRARETASTDADDGFNWSVPA